MLIPFALGSLAGATSLQFLSVLPLVRQVIEGDVIGIIIVAICFLTNKIAMRFFGIFLIGIMMGFGWAYTQSADRLQWVLAPDLFGHSIEITGEVVGIVHKNAQGATFDLDLTHFAGKKIKSNAKVRLFLQSHKQRLSAGDKLRCHAKLMPPWHFANPGSFDREKQFFIEGIRAVGKITTLDDYQPAQGRSLDHLRQDLYEEMGKLLQGKPLLGVIQATTLGVYKNISPEQWQVFQATGTTHAIAISGLHVGLVAMLFYGFVTAVVRRFHVLTTWYPATCYGAVAGMSSAFVYCALAGFSIPTQRSLVMIIVAMSAILRRQRVFSWDALALAWIGIACLDPLAPLQMGFWLSFGCVGALIYARSHAVGENRWRQWIVPQIVVFIGLIPLTMLFFQQVAVLSPLANFIVLPIINFAVVPASLLGLALIGVAPLLAKISLWVAHTALLSVWGILDRLAHFSFSLWQSGTMPPSYLWLALGGIFLLLGPKGLPAQSLGWFTFLPLVFYEPPLVSEQTCRFTLLDVGQGLAAVVQTRHHALLYDAGPQYGQSDAGKNIIKPFLISQHIKTLDKIIISHGDLDHRAGLNGLRDWPIGEIISSEPARLKMSARVCVKGESWEWDGVRFTILSPAELVQKNRNNLSCVLKVSTPYQSILLTGDIEQSGEKYLMSQMAESLSSHILVVPHHGSLTSSSPAFVKAVSPRYALYPVGMGNRYGFPKAPILARYEAIGSENLLVSETGALMFELKEEGLNPPIRWREVKRRFWHT